MAIACVSTSAFPSLLDIPIGIISSAIELKICATTAGIKKYKSIIKKKNKKDDKIVFLAKTDLSLHRSLNFLKGLTDSYISHDEFILVNNVSKECDDMKEKIKNLKDLNSKANILI